MLDLSWRIALPKYSQIKGGYDELILRKINSCAALTSPSTFRLSEQVGIAATPVEFTRVYVNGAYLR